MLILTRKPGESLYIGDNIKITIVEIKGHQIRVGIDAPQELRIYREEIYLQILEENKKAAEAASVTEAGLESLTQAWQGRGSAEGSLEVKPLRPKTSALQPVSSKVSTPEVMVKRKKPRSNE
ncbi:MAG: carbon storage regulator CsrA [Deltaproteobacteria bacterium]|nr:carbon storage regulator CsrA [Deltaproteobacteria bacterium]